jgi:hypothetical protein
VYVGGDFTRAGNVVANGIAKWDGREWSAVGQGLGGCRDSQCSPTVYTLAVVGGRVYAGGRFLTAGGAPAHGIAVWDGYRWSSVGGGLRTGDYDGVVRALAIAGPKIYAGGSFRSAGTVNVNNIAMWDGQKWSPLAAGIGGGMEQVLGIAVQDGNVFAVGNFSRAGKAAVANAARWDGSTWAAVEVGANDAIQAAAAHGGSVYLAGGAFQLPSGEMAWGVVKGTGRKWSGLGSGLGNGPYLAPVTTLGVAADRVVAGGGPFVLADEPSGAPRRSASPTNRRHLE